MNTNNNGQLFLRVGVASLMVAAASILVANLLDDLNEVMWTLLVPIGILGGLALGVSSLGLYAARRRA